MIGRFAFLAVLLLASCIPALEPKAVADNFQAGELTLTVQNVALPAKGVTISLDILEGQLFTNDTRCTVVDNHYWSCDLGDMAAIQNEAVKFAVLSPVKYTCILAYYVNDSYEFMECTRAGG